MKGSNQDAEWAHAQDFLSVGGGQVLYAKLAWLAASLVGVGWVFPAIANTSPPVEDSPLNPEHRATHEVASPCGTFPIENYVSHDSAALKQSFCELLTFKPYHASEREGFLSQILPESLTSDDQPSAEEMTLPSLWWSQNSLPRQFGSYRLVESWTAYEIRASATRVVDVHVNPQIWRILQYPERYGALSHLAEEAMYYQYNLRLFNNNLRTPRLIGLYVCDFGSNRPGKSDGGVPATSGGGCSALIDPETIIRLQASLTSPDTLVQPEISSPQDSSPEAVVGSNPSPETELQGESQGN
jgi:hypothetical protein